jgi:drug/metabolite transporter (DMT)-like permease
LVPLAAFLALGERVSLQGGIGILIVMAGLYVVLIRGNTTRGLWQLWAALRMRDSRWAFATLGTVVAYSIIDKAGMLAFSRVEEISPGFQGVIFFLLANVLSTLLFWTYMSFESSQELRSIWAQEWPKIVAAALGTLASYGLILFVMRIEKVSYIVTLRQTSVVFAVLVGWLFLKEEFGKVRLIASVVMLLGFYLVATAN